MWQPADSIRSRAAWALACGVVCSATVVRAQTIADYSRAQRAMLEAAMTQAAARSAGLAASAPASPASVPSGLVPIPLAAGMATIAARPTPPSPSPVVQVSGVVTTSAGSLAEVVVDASAYLLRAGDGVPGTAWRVETVAIDRVVLSRPGRGVVTDAESSRRTFALPVLR
jgi:hypothetical protein